MLKLFHFCCQKVYRLLLLINGFNKVWDKPCVVHTLNSFIIGRNQFRHQGFYLMIRFI